ncbi:predicted protein, partial [Thalassiosira pseudonana CCMP1335]
MSILLETTFGDIVLDLDVEGSPALSRNILKLTKARYYTNTLIYNVVPGRYCQMGGDTQTSSNAPPDVSQSQRRFLQSHGRFLSPNELQQKGLVIAMEMENIPHTIGSQFLITLKDNAATRKGHAKYLSLGTVAEDSQDVLSKLNRAYCDDDGRPFADIRIQRALVLHDPFDDPEADDTTLFPNVEEQSDEDEDEETKQKRLELQQKQEEEWKKKQDNSRAVMLEMLGDLPSAEIKAPENVLFVCKLNPFTNDEDLELIFSRFDQNAKAEIIRDPDTGSSLQYAFVEFTSNEACNEAYLKMNNALVDDRR